MIHAKYIEEMDGCNVVIKGDDESIYAEMSAILTGAFQDNDLTLTIMKAFNDRVEELEEKLKNDQNNISD